MHTKIHRLNYYDLKIYWLIFLKKNYFNEGFGSKSVLNLIFIFLYLKGLKFEPSTL